MSRTFHIRTFGCQMNVHDSDKVSNLLHFSGYRAAASEAEADLVVINTCSIREKAEHRLYSDLGTLRAWKAERPGRLIGVGGCVAQQEGDTLLKRFPQLDFVFGTHNLRWVPALLEAARCGSRRSETAESRSLERFDLPERHPAFAPTTPARAFVTVMEGCDMFCSFCIVPRTRGREISRPADAIVAEIEALVESGVAEVTLLGQTVNAYGRHNLRRGHGERAKTVAFSELLGRIDRVPGIRRVRYTSPHPLFFDEALIRAHGELESLCPHIHLPAQSGSDRILERMRRRYRSADLLRLVEKLRLVRSDLALTTDLIVGFPGESEEDFTATLELVRAIGFVDSYSFKYSPRPATRAADLPDQIPPEVAQERLERLQALQRELTISYHRKRVGEKVEILIEGLSRRGSQVAGRDPYHRVVNLAHESDAGPAPGRLITAEIVEATPHSLLAVLPGAWESETTRQFH